MDVYVKFLLLIVIHLQIICYSYPLETRARVQTLPGEGLSFDKCKNQNDCAGNRICEGPESNGTSCSSDGQDCRCYSNPNQCLSNRDCDDGEVCIEESELHFSVCASRKAMEKKPFLSLTNRFNSESDITESPDLSENVEEGDDTSMLGLNFDECASHTDCAGSRICHGLYAESVSCAIDDNDCFCYPNLDRCKSSGDCEKGELCVRGSSYGYLLCVSVNALQDFPMLTPLEENELEGTSPPSPTDFESDLGLNFDGCSNEADCKGYRGCHGPYPKSISCPADTLGCACYQNWDACATSADCDEGEVCADGSTSGSLVCISVNALSDFPMLTSMDAESLRTKLEASPFPREQKEAEGQESNLGLNYDKCSLLKKCSGRRECIEPGIDGKNCTGEARNCRCYPGKDRCFSNDECDEKEVCKTFIRTGNNVCASEDAAIDSAIFQDLATEDQFPVTYTSEEPEQETPEAGTSGPYDPNLDRNPDACIDSKALIHFGTDELVFKKHQMASVLCDSAGSCATPGHMVIWKGRGMMMKTYCLEVARCHMEDILVNSPRWSVGKRVQSKTKGLAYTVFAARYETKLEEIALKTAALVL